jgi:hypothetical protein
MSIKKCGHSAAAVLIAWFRGDHAYVLQLRGSNSNFLGYVLALYYVESIATLGRLDKLEEHHASGVFVFQNSNWPGNPQYASGCQC